MDHDSAKKEHFENVVERVGEEDVAQAREDDARQAGVSQPFEADDNVPELEIEKPAEETVHNAESTPLNCNGPNSDLVDVAADDVEGAACCPAPLQTEAAPAPPPSPPPSADESRLVYQVKWVTFHGKKTAIITQNENGPCPLLSIVNVLLLRGKMSLPQGDSIVSSELLLQQIADLMLEAVPKNVPSAERLNYEQNMHDAISLLPKLQTGLDVNVRFTSVSDFEYTSSCVIFDLLDITLYHGWLTDPQQAEVAAAVGKLSYNQLVDKIITNKNSTDSEQVGEALVAQQFLEESASQLTYHGLCELMSKLGEGELAVFFRNNHFSTIYKHKHELFLLVTDQGFLKEPRVVWETLSNVDNDSHFVDEKFVTAPPKEPVMDGISDTRTSEQQIDQDRLLALTLAEEEKLMSGRQQEWRENLGEEATTLTDEELAKRLQEEENRAAAEEEAEQLRQQQQEGQARGGGEQPQRPDRAPRRDGAAAQDRHGGEQGRHGQRPREREREKNCVIL